MRNLSKELIYYSPEFSGKENFSGEFSPVGVQERKEYLAKYAELLKAQYGLGELPKKVVDKDEEKELLRKYALPESENENVLRFTEMETYTRNARSPYCGWQFYTYGTEVEDEIICFKDGVTPPVPAAKYEFDGEKRLSEFAFSFYSEKFATLRARPHVTNTKGRVFELRSGMHTVIKLQLLTDGNLYYLDGSRGTHLKLVFLCKCNEWAWTEIKIALCENACDIFIDGKAVAQEQKLYTDKNPDNFFVSGGMFSFGNWKLRPLIMKTADKSVKEFFKPVESKDEEETFLGNMQLPYCIGTYDNKDKELVFRKRFDFEIKKYARLTIKSIDPCGSVSLNGHTVYQADNFLSKTLDVTRYVKAKDNLLEIVVKPRAPEVFYQWHKHSDPYVGWFFCGAYLENYGDNYVEDICVTTDKIVNGNVTASVNATLFGKGNAEISLREIYPERGKEIKIDQFEYCGETKLNKQYVFSAKIWDTEHPNLYEIVIRVDGYEKNIETGFRIIEQKNGEIHLNGQRVLLNGALSMQFLPPYKEIPVNHLCPSDAQIVTQLEQIKRMNGNTLRMHFLGYGSNDARWARFADRMGCMLIWTTRLIDSVESIFMNDEWRMADAYAEQIKEVRQYPSIIMWEGSNEAKGLFPQIDKIYDQFVTTVKAVDKTRLLCPCSHLYYGGGLYDSSREIPCEYYQENGLADQDMNPAKSSFGWLDEDVVRSAHTYEITLGYGCEWDWLVKQEWKAQAAMLQSKKHAYIVSEYAIIGRMCPDTEETKEYFNPNSYEFGNEYSSLNTQLSNDEYELSQAHQALCALYVNKKMRMLDVDGMLWCCLQGGANDASYLKPIIDFYGYAKFAFYILKDYYRNNYCIIDCDGPFWNSQSKIRPILISEKGTYHVCVQVLDEYQNVVYKKGYEVQATAWQSPLGVCDWTPSEAGYYIIQTEVTKL